MNRRRGVELKVAPGDIWIVRAADISSSLRRHALVLNADNAMVHVCLLSNEVDLATDYDIILDGAVTQCGYRLMVETLMLGRVTRGQLVRQVGWIKDQMVDDILDFIWDERPDSLEPLRGLPSRTKGTARLELEALESVDLAALVARSQITMIDAMRAPVKDKTALANLGRFRSVIMNASGDILTGYALTVRTEDGELAEIFDRKGRHMANPTKTAEHTSRRHGRGEIEFRATLGPYLLVDEDGTSFLVAACLERLP